MLQVLIGAVGPGPNDADAVAPLAKLPVPKNPYKIDTHPGSQNPLGNKIEVS